jgi:hypothetical protein
LEVRWSLFEAERHALPDKFAVLSDEYRVLLHPLAQGYIMEGGLKIKPCHYGRLVQRFNNCLAVIDRPNNWGALCIHWHKITAHSIVLAALPFLY